MNNSSIEKATNSKDDPVLCLPIRILNGIFRRTDNLSLFVELNLQFDDFILFFNQQGDF